MSALNNSRFIERPQFFDGQTLFAHDMQTIEAFNREMRWLHNEMLHQTGAIGNGYAVQGEKGDRVVTIGPGLALDDRGREIVLIHDATEPVPPISGDEDGGPAYYDLTVSYPDDDQLDVSETRTGLCQSAGAVRLREKPIITWVRLKKSTATNGKFEAVDLEQRAAIKRGEMVVIARAEVLNCQLNDVLSLKQRRNARPSCIPYIAAGAASDLDWKIWLGIDRDALLDVLVERYLRGHEMTFSQALGFSFSGLPLLETFVDTTQAAFAATPHYSARIDGARLQVENLIGGSSDEDPSREVQWFIDAILYIMNPTPSGFTAQIMIHVNRPEILGPLIDLEQLGPIVADVSECVEASAEDRLAIRQCLADYLEALDELVDGIIPEAWQIVWMGVEG